ncbi:hypothetical protein GRI40_12670 [Altererythrobacter aerius]|uniref:Uncharacterized protein n=1 Tax=Tsuneonella aeria TaxID=1837929 RepID=A0A6I4TES3_9SPHN|nr:hypothetical protein [Tsuneonella aeria]MXO76069.1 hypothetical protein [Tsuneonella aeria]
MRGKASSVPPPIVPLAGLLLAAACSSPEPAAQPDEAPRGEPATVTPAPREPDAAATVPPASDAADSAANVLTLEGLGDLLIGRPVPADSSFASRGAQVPGTDCRTMTSRSYPDVYALIQDGQVRRVTVAGDSPVTLAGGIGVGATEAAVEAAYPGLVEDAHEYVAAPGKYLTQPGSGARLRFEIDSDRRVSAIHAGLMPQLGYVEGCA